MYILVTSKAWVTPNRRKVEHTSCYYSQTIWKRPDLATHLDGRMWRHAVLCQHTTNLKNTVFELSRNLTKNDLQVKCLHGIDFLNAQI